MASKIGFLFPGQGAQYVGMGKDLCEQFPAVKALYEKADKILGYCLSSICFQGPEDSLTRTLYAQPAIFVTSLAVLTVLKEKYPEVEPSLVAGLSLGEFSALVASKAMSFEDGLRLVHKRASAMEKAAQNNPGTMASIMGMSQPDCEGIAREAGCDLANLNSPDQFVVSGTEAAIEKACQLAESRGAKRALRLKVGGAFHSRLMQEAKEALETAIGETKIEKPRCVFIPNVTAQAADNVPLIKELLAKQLISSVQWIKTMERATESKIPTFLEVGPGKVLKGLAKKCQPSLSVLPCGSVEDIQKLEEIFRTVSH